jgi:hypothetical protein
LEKVLLLIFLELKYSLPLWHFTPQIYALWVPLGTLASEPRKWSLPQNFKVVCYHFFILLKTTFDIHFNLGFPGRKVKHEPYITTTDPIPSFLD